VRLALLRLSAGTGESTPEAAFLLMRSVLPGALLWAARWLDSLVSRPDRRPRGAGASASCRVDRSPPALPHGPRGTRTGASSQLGILATGFARSAACAPLRSPAPPRGGCVHGSAARCPRPNAASTCGGGAAPARCGAGLGGDHCGEESVDGGAVVR
jgi:hypothetical protein